MRSPPQGEKQIYGCMQLIGPPQGCKGWPYSSLDQLDRAVKRRVQQQIDDLPPQYVPDVLEETSSDAEDQPLEDLSSLGESGSSSSD